ncbi:MAG: CsgG/HfaB family protein [Blastocatellia bacterium]
MVGLILVHWANAQGAQERVYIWDFTDRDGKQTDLTTRLTAEFEEALSKAKCYQVLERRQFDRLLAHIKNEKAIIDLNDISKASRVEVRTITNAQIVVFGRVDDDLDSGQVKISVSLQRFDSTKEVRSIRIPRGQRFDSQSRENAMQQLVQEICPPVQSPSASQMPQSGAPLLEHFAVGSQKRGSIVDGQHRDYQFGGVANSALIFTIRVEECTPNNTGEVLAGIFDMMGRQIKRNITIFGAVQELQFTPPADGEYVLKLQVRRARCTYAIYQENPR